MQTLCLILERTWYLSEETNKISNQIKKQNK